MTALRKILVVDDDPVIRKSFDRVLTGKGYAVIAADSGEEALRKLNEEKYDVVYTDIRMPGMNGLEVAEKIKARRPWMPVVVITGYGTEIAEERAKIAGVASFLHKPLSPEMIEGSARDALAARAEAPETASAPAAAANEAAGVGTVVKNIALFLVAPFIGLAYIIALPFVGLAVLAVLAARAAAETETAKAVGIVAKHAGMLIAAPFLGLAFIIVVPFVGLAVLAGVAARAAAETETAKAVGMLIAGAASRVGLYRALPVPRLGSVAVARIESVADLGDVEVER